MRNLINLIEAVQKGCPLATHDIDENLKNRQTAIDEYHYGPANPDHAEDYWTKSAKGFKVSVATPSTLPLNPNKLGSRLLPANTPFV